MTADGPGLVGASGNARAGGANSDMKPSAEASGLDGAFRRRMKGPANENNSRAKPKPKAANKFAADDLDDLDDLMGGESGGGGLVHDDSDFFADNNRDDDDFIPKKKRGQDNDPLAFL